MRRPKNPQRLGRYRVFALWASLVLRLLTLIWLLTILRLLLGLLTILGLVFPGLLALFLLCLVVLVRSPLRAISAQIFLSGLLRGLRTGGRLLGGRSLARTAGGAFFLRCTNSGACDKRKHRH